jgi:hypothetical protein
MDNFDGSTKTLEIHMAEVKTRAAVTNRKIDMACKPINFDEIPSVSRSKFGFLNDLDFFDILDAWLEVVKPFDYFQKDFEKMINRTDKRNFFILYDENTMREFLIHTSGCSYARYIAEVIE